MIQIWVARIDIWFCEAALFGKWLFVIGVLLVFWLAMRLFLPREKK